MQVDNFSLIIYHVIIHSRDYVIVSNDRKEADYVIDPSLIPYTNKFYSSLLLLYEVENSSDIIDVISSLSVLSSNRKK